MLKKIVARRRGQALTAWLERSICFFALGCIAFAQAPSAGGQPLVTLNVTVTNQSGRPVSGLRAQDFTVLEKKHPQPILSVQEVKGAGPAAAQAKVILLIDEVNTDFRHVSFERQQVIKFLGRDNGALARPVALAFLTDLTVKFTNFSEDGNALIRELNANPPDLRTIGKDQGVWGAGDRLNLSLKSLEETIARASGEPGRKILVWVSPGWPILTGPEIQLSSSDERNLFREIVNLSDALQKADMTICSVDPLGTADAVEPRTTWYEDFRKGVKKPQQVQYGNVALQVLAIQSGGRVFDSENDLVSEISEAISTADDYYILTYAATPADGPDDYHPVEVKVDQPRTKVLARTGYYAQP